MATNIFTDTDTDDDSSQDSEDSCYDTNCATGSSTSQSRKRPRTRHSAASHDGAGPATKKRAVHCTTDSGITAGDDSSSDNDDPASPSDPCAICLGRLKGPVGSPENCDHSFCLDCILEWSKVSCAWGGRPVFELL